MAMWIIRVYLSAPYEAARMAGGPLYSNPGGAVRLPLRGYMPRTRFSGRAPASSGLCAPNPQQETGRNGSLHPPSAGACAPDPDLMPSHLVLLVPDAAVRSR